MSPVLDTGIFLNWKGVTFNTLTPCSSSPWASKTRVLVLLRCVSSPLIGSPGYHARKYIRNVVRLWQDRLRPLMTISRASISPIPSASYPLHRGYPGASREAVHVVVRGKVVVETGGA